VACAQAWLDIHAVMRHALETMHSGGRPIWNGRAPIIARNATSSEATAWSKLRDELAAAGELDEPDIITVWLIPTSGEQRTSDVPRN
jgi:hypothetical protein